MTLFKLLAFWLLTVPFCSHADGFLFTAGESSVDGHPSAYRLAYIHGTDQSWDFATDHVLALEVEFSGFYWENDYDSDTYGASIIPMFRYFIPDNNLSYFVGLGIGASYISETTWHNKDLGIHFQFEDKLEFGIEMTKQHRVSLGITHYSNAGLSDENGGANIWQLNYSYHWQ